MMRENLVQIGRNVLELGALMFLRKTKVFGMMKLRNMIVGGRITVTLLSRFSSNGSIVY